MLRLATLKIRGFNSALLVVFRLSGRATKALPPTHGSCGRTCASIFERDTLLSESSPRGEQAIGMPYLQYK
jgi:hypothetical protein